MKNICIIPARGNSKRIKNKNIRSFNQKPIISFAINVAKRSNLFDHILVSTESSKIAEIAKEHGAEIPFIRPINLSDDYTSTQSVINHAISQCENLGMDFNYVCCIYPCVPLLNPNDLEKSFEIINDLEDKFIFPVAETPSNSYRSLGMKENESIYPLFSNFENLRTQDLEKTFFDVGQFYWGHKSIWKKAESIYKNSKGYIIPKWKAIDIDNEEDWFLAELMYTNLERRNKIEYL